VSGEHTGLRRRHRGLELPGEDAVAYALRQPLSPEKPPTTAEPAGPARTAPETSAVPLTRRELQVAYLVAQGRSNKQIAAELVISQRTAEGHVERILTKLGFTSRVQVAAWIASATAAGPDSPALGLKVGWQYREHPSL
jgi:DNA-binding NarL/FixJ family response regulator